MDDVCRGDGCEEYEECEEAPVDAEPLYNQDVHAYEECMTEVDFVGNATEETENGICFLADCIDDENQCDGQ